jgi:phage-related protein
MPTDWPLVVVFYRLDSGREPVREWLRGLDKETKRIIGEDIKTVQFGWPLGMPLARKLAPELWEVRSSIDRRIARVLFTVIDRNIVLLHGFIKKTQQTPSQDLALAKRRLNNLRSGM